MRPSPCTALDDYIRDAGVARPLSGAMTDHLRGCETCRIGWEKIAQACRMVDGTVARPSAPPSPGAALAAMNRLRRDGAGVGTGRAAARRLPPIMLAGGLTACAAGTVCLVGIGLMRNHAHGPGELRARGLDRRAAALPARRPALTDRSPVVAVAPRRTGIAAITIRSGMAAAPIRHGGTALLSHPLKAAVPTESAIDTADIAPNRATAPDPGRHASSLAARQARSVRPAGFRGGIDPGVLAGSPGTPPGAATGRRERALPDDLAYLNAAAPAPVRPLPYEGRRRRGDDFVTIPRPQIAASPSRATRSLIAAAVEDYRKEEAVVDERLARKVDLEIKGGDLKTLMDRLAQQTGVRFYVSKDLEDVKVTVLVKQAPARDVMRQVVRLFNLEWRRRGEEGHYTYELIQTLKQKLAEEQLKRADRDQMLLDATAQMDSYLPYKDRPQSELKALADEAQRQADTAGSVEERERELGRYRILSMLADDKGGDLLNIYSSLTPDQLIALQNGEPVTFRFRGDGSDSSLTRDYAERIRAGAIREFSPGGASARADRLWWAQTPIEDEQIAVTFRMDRSRPDQSVLSVGLRFEAGLQNGAMADGSGKGSDGGGASGKGASAGSVAGKVFSAGKGAGAIGGYDWGSDVLVIGQPDGLRNPDNTGAHAPLASQPQWRAPVDLHPHADASAAPAPGPWAQDLLDRPARPGDASPSPKEWIDSADFLAELHEKTGRNIVADYYTRIYPPSAFAASNEKLVDALDGAADTLKSSWQPDGDFIRLRRFDYYSERAMDVPNRLLAQWSADRKRLGHLSMDDLAEMAALPDTVLQHRDLGRALLLKYGLDEWPLAYSARAELRFFATLNADQRARALTADGLPFTDLSPDQLAAAQTSARRPAAFTPDQIARGQFRARFREPGTYEWYQMSKDPSDAPIVATLQGTSRAAIEAKIADLARSHGGGSDEIEAMKRGIAGPGAAVLTRFDYGDDYFARETNGSHSLMMSSSGGAKE